MLAKCLKKSEPPRRSLSAGCLELKSCISLRLVAVTVYSGGYP